MDVNENVTITDLKLNIDPSKLSLGQSPRKIYPLIVTVVSNELPSAEQDVVSNIDFF